VVELTTTVYQISDFTLSREYAEKKRSEGYQIEELKVIEETPYEFILLEGC
jgi:hypothetical protein